MPSKLPSIPGHLIEGGLATDFRFEVARLLDRKNPNFPGAQPISFNRHHLEALCKEDYFLCEKTDGIRCLLYCTQDEHANEIHYLIDRKNDYYFLQGLHLPHQSDPSFARFHVDTLLDGELVIDSFPDGTETLRYLVFDCIVLDKENLIHKTFNKRIGRFQAYVEQPLKALYKEFPAERKYFPFEVVMKVMDKPYALEDMFDIKLPSLPHGNDGLVFTAADALYTSGTDNMILKWKPANENSIDFKLQLGGFPMYDPRDGEPGMIEDWDAKPEFNLLVYWGKGDYRHFTELYVTDAEWTSMKALNEQLDGRIIECYKDNEGRWRFKQEANGAPRFREDKPEANHISTVNKVLESIEHGVTEQELRAAAGSIQKAWKARHPEENRRANGHG